MEDAATKFDWDAGNTEKCQKHGVTIAEIEALLAGSPRIAPDARHSQTEQRFIAVGRTDQDRPLFIAFTVRTRSTQRLVRPLSARYMHKEEIESYEKENSDIQE